MTVTWQNVFSEVADAIGYDSEAGEMLVQWSETGRISAYKDVPAEVAHACANNYSVGSFLHSEVKGKYTHRYV